MATAYPVAPGDEFQLKVGVRLLTVTPGTTVLPGDNPVGSGGTGTLTAETLKLIGFELPPPGGGFDTTTDRLPAVARSAALSIIVN
jgi:hypothetical protein